MNALLAIKGDPVDYDMVLAQLAMRTAKRKEDESMTGARYEILVKDLSKFSPATVAEACYEYAHHTKWWPDGIADLMPFLEKVESRRKGLPLLMHILANEARRRRDEIERKRKVADQKPITAEEFRAAMVGVGVLVDEGQMASRPQRKMPTVQDYMDTGLTRRAAEAAVAEQSS